MSQSRFLLICSLALTMLGVPLLGGGELQAQTLTPKQQAIVSRALASVNTDAPPSYVSNPFGGPTTWLTDIAGGDGVRMRAAALRYRNWYWSNPATRVPLSQIKNSMIADFAQSNYDATRKSMLVDRIVLKYNSLVAQYGFQIQTPTTDQATLSFLGVRQQCLEWCNYIAILSNGTPRGYDAPNVPGPAQRPGMMVTMVIGGSMHAAIITRIDWNGATPIRYTLAEANMGNGWQNPFGAVPWQRRVTGNRTVIPSQISRVISFE